MTRRMTSKIEILVAVSLDLSDEVFWRSGSTVTTSRWVIRDGGSTKRKFFFSFSVRQEHKLHYVFDVLYHSPLPDLSSAIRHLRIIFPSTTSSWWRKDSHASSALHVPILQVQLRKKNCSSFSGSAGYTFVSLYSARVADIKPVDRKLKNKSCRESYSQNRRVLYPAVLWLL
jgi:hypothetical protein